MWIDRYKKEGKLKSYVRIKYVFLFIYVILKHQKGKLPYKIYL